ncbi:MAG: shikimate dehydrogenase [Actinobacteria bacterium]|nr:shikimate dehydrogenase [Actinomycetota bacterium]
MSPITGATRLAAVIGDPVEHSRSPAIHNAAYAATDLDWVYVALRVPPGLGGDAVRAMPALGIRGLNVTMPHKEAAAAACDELSPVAAALGVVNTVVLRADGRVRGDSTDGEGLLRSLAEVGLDPSGRRVAVLGAGGVARAVVLAIGAAGAEVTVVGRRPEACASAAALVQGVEARPWAEAGQVAAAVDVVVNATPIGMGADGAGMLPSAGRGQWAVDLVYHPARTAFLTASERAGAEVVGGLGMLVHQAALAFEQMTGRDAPIEAMRRAAEGAGTA